MAKAIPSQPSPEVVVKGEMSTFKLGANSEVLILDIESISYLLYSTVPSYLSVMY